MSQIETPVDRPSPNYTLKDNCNIFIHSLPSQMSSTDANAFCLEEPILDKKVIIRFLSFCSFQGQFSNLHFVAHSIKKGQKTSPFSGLFDGIT